MESKDWKVDESEWKVEFNDAFFRIIEIQFGHNRMEWKKYSNDFFIAALNFSHRKTSVNDPRNFTTHLIYTDLQK